jgi:hypothetical protein
MSLDSLACIYFAGATITGLSTMKLKYFYRAVLLWPLFWAFILIVIIEMAAEDIRHG